MKKQLEQKRLKKKQEKAERKQERQESSQGGKLEDMLMYVDENGNFSSTPPIKKKEEPKTAAPNPRLNKKYWE
ncbi:cold-shock protein [Rufibacter roseus]|uniref:Cold-shock protein n=2 Tax=Rufibacter roseus TaxID=1567108 RepID=A0ABW2DQZ5_9BACT|nr:cold-shock protein [Rufibacter roseus]